MSELIKLLAEEGVAQGLGIFFLLFLTVAVAMMALVWWVLKTGVQREKSIQDNNKEREARYVATIEVLATTINTKIAPLEVELRELRRENSDCHKSQKGLLQQAVLQLAGGGGKHRNEYTNSQRS